MSTTEFSDIMRLLFYDHYGDNAIWKRFRYSSSPDKEPELSKESVRREVRNGYKKYSHQSA